MVKIVIARGMSLLNTLRQKRYCKYFLGLSKEAILESVMDSNVHSSLCVTFLFFTVIP